ncbi:hypothetical protein AAC387_Pa10g1013 [Persea americana]
MYNNTRLVMDTSGQLTCQVWYDASKSWGLAWVQPRDSCSIYAACGAYGICNNHNNPICKCMRGFEPASPSNWNSGNWSAGCVRKAQLECWNKDGFLLMGRIKIPDGETSAIAKSAEECRAQCVSNCSCSAYAYANTSGGAGSSCLVWYGRLMDAGDLTVEEKDDGARYVYIRVAASELSSNKRRRLLVILIVSLVLVSLIFGTTIYCFFKMTKKNGNRAKTLKMSVLHLRTSAATAYDFLDPHQFGEDGSNDIPRFHFESIAMATENFSISNKLGQGGFGAVYKGILPWGQEIAVKRLSNNSGQGLEEFTNEVILIAKLQHRNLVRLLGYCIEDDEMLLVYEYMPNKSLDFILFDPNRCVLLNWERRFNIILGIARGLLYLHQDSRLRIIHRDLKAGNILLDKDMNPKISDFGIARIFGGNQTQANTRRIFGTYGYMSPEYAIKGHFSIKSDVFSFGVIVLEIISGKKNTSFTESEDSLSLLGHAWHLWIEGKGMDLIDPSLIESCDAQEVLKCLQVRLLCVQEDPKNRPTMASVVMFLSDSARLPTPEQPPFYLRTSSRQDNSSGNPKSCSINEVTITLLDSR